MAVLCLCSREPIEASSFYEVPFSLHLPAFSDSSYYIPAFGTLPMLLVCPGLFQSYP